MTDFHGRERRRWFRVTPKGSVIVRVAGHAQRGRLVNLSAGGMFALTSVTMPKRLLGRAADVAVRLDGGCAEWLDETGRIDRIDAHGIAIAFDTVSPTLQRSIDEAASAARARTRVLSVILIDVDNDRRSAMAAGFRAAGCAIVEASTPLEAIVRLGESSFEPDVVAVADSYPIAIAQALRAFVLREHPRAKLVTIGDEVFHPDGIATWLSSSNPDAARSR